MALVEFVRARSAAQSATDDPVSADVPIILAPWPEKPTFTTATLTAAPERLDSIRALTDGAWYVVRNESAQGTGDVYLLADGIRPAADHAQRATIPPGQITFIRWLLDDPTWVWGAGAVMEVATAAWNRAILVLSSAVPQRALTSGRDDVDALGMVASARVEREAPGAPQAMRNEAVIRFAAYLGESLAGGAGSVRKATTGPFDREFQTNHSGAWRHSGAGALLAPWKRHRGGMVG